MATTTNNDVRLTIRYADYSTHSYTFSGVPDEEIAGVETRARAANTTWTTDNMNYAFMLKDETNPTMGIQSTGITAIRITSTEEEVLFGG